MAKKEVNYKALAKKNKRIREFRERKKIATTAKSNQLSPGELKSHLDRFQEEKPEDRGKKYTFGLVTLDEDIKRKDIPGAYKVFYAMSDRLAEEKEMPKEEVEKYQKALAKRGYRLVSKLHKDHMYNPENEDILKYCDEHLDNESTGLEKSITAVSLLSLVLGIAIGYPALTGNVIAENVKGSFIAGVALFVVGLLGVFVANRE
ncbi:MAG: hypothetical protein NTZ83_03750 [Candidatus Pacearchaeota archaeon]|nr:hypothetical protein [Candidatus Pacearchaeota archaeon]